MLTVLWQFIAISEIEIFLPGDPARSHCPIEFPPSLVLLPRGREQEASGAFSCSTAPGSLHQVAADGIAPVHSSERDTLPHSTPWALAVPPDHTCISPLNRHTISPSSCSQGWLRGPATSTGAQGPALGEGTPLSSGGQCSVVAILQFSAFYL